MRTVALIVLVLTALTGLVVLGAWLALSSVRRARTGSGRHRRLPPLLVFGHVGFAVSAATAWIVYVFGGRAFAGWLSLALLVIVAASGLTMFVRWVPSYRSREAFDGARPSGRHRARDPRGSRRRGSSERNLPITAVLAHGALALTTVTLVILTLLG
ncbi:hypothetical protein [Tsukamurella pseudospumae]|uniref:DUF2269 domain-containing protein n=1 Tax=Tsukamurella pseudospumae TaxID=239498 RepID=A0A138ATS6_9ACTN|nr:hypothetical protein [Tsukamurella pseudospumae]KXO97857.1 hypothetical protein AXK61_21030 [Tsukamurella pseudospumae]KXP13834.1 hypothetical protein AXK60_22970 [Tsukamurella pseudospumae]